MSEHINSIESFQDGRIIVITQNSCNIPTPLFCPCCKFPMKNLVEDPQAFKNHGVCSHCDGRFTNYPGVSWKDKSMYPEIVASAFWNEYLEERRILSRSIINFK